MTDQLLDILDRRLTEALVTHATHRDDPDPMAAGLAATALAHLGLIQELMEEVRELMELEGTDQTAPGRYNRMADMLDAIPLAATA